MKTMISIVICAFIPILTLNTVFAQAESSHVKNSGFEMEGVVNNQPGNWDTAGNVIVQRVGGTWHRLTARFNSGNQKEVSLFFIAEKGSKGSVWIDNITSSLVQIRNASFEETGSNAFLLSWNADNKNTTIFLDSERASDGHKSVRITHVNDMVPTSRIWQNIPVLPNREYSISFDFYVGDDFQGEVKGLIFDASHSHCLVSNWGETFASPLVELRDRCGTYNVLLTPTKKNPAMISQVLDVKQDLNLQAVADINNKAFKGKIKFVVKDPASGKLLKQKNLESVSENWQTLQMSLQSETEKLCIQVIAEGEGYLQLDNIAVTSPNIIPPLQEVQWLPASDNFNIPSKLRVFIEGQHGKAVVGGLSLLEHDLENYGVLLETIASPEKCSLQILISEQYQIKEKGNEAYFLNIDTDGIIIKAANESGAFYGLMSLLQLLTKPKDKLVAVACKITDYPDMPLRGVLYGDPEQAARWKMNTLMYSTGTLSVANEQKQFRKLVRKCQNLNLKLIPYFHTLYIGCYIEKINPNLAVGIWVENERITLHGTQPSFLANKYVIRTKLTDVLLTNADKSKQYELGKDYKIIDGDISYPYKQSNPKSFGVARLPGSAIPDEATVLASYDYVSYYRHSTNRTDPHIAYCPVESKVNELMAEHLTNIAKEYPFIYINIGDDLEEFRPTEAQLETDSRVIRSGKTPTRLLAEDVSFLDKAVKSGNPKARILQWAGQVNEYSKIAAEFLPKDALINIWGYDVNWPLQYGRDAITFWSKRGYQTSVMPWNNLCNIRIWAQVVAEARANGYPCLGMIDSCWKNIPNPMGGVQETAIVSWKIPKPGEKRFIVLPAGK